MNFKPLIVHILPVNVAPGRGEEGTSFMIKELYEHLNEEFNFFIIGKRPKSQYAWSIPAFLIKIPESSFYRMPYHFYKKLYNERLKRILKDLRGDTILFYEDIELALWYKERYPYKSVGVTIFFPWDRKKIQRVSNKRIEDIDYIVFCSNWLKHYFVSRCMKFKDAKVIHNFIDVEKFSPVWDNVEMREFMRTRFNVKDKFVIFFVGRISPEKRPHLIIQALYHLPSYLTKNITVFFAGNVWYGRNYRTSYYKSFIGEIKQSPYDIRLLGFVDREQLKYFYWMSDVVVVPSIVESFCLVAAEAMACGIPVITTRSGGLVEVVDRVGFFAKDCAEDIAKTILYLIDHPRERRFKSIEGRRRIEENFSLEKISRRWKDLFKKAIE